MIDIVLIGDKTFLFEKLFSEAGVTYQFLQPGALGSPFLPPYRMAIIPTGFANPQYSQALPALRRHKAGIEKFLKGGGVLTVFGPLVAEHNYEWLPLELKYICQYAPQKVVPSDHQCSCLLSTSTPECDGYLIPGKGFDTVMLDSQGRAILAAGRYGEGLIVATSAHEFPSGEYIGWALSRSKPSRL
jgi:hypothetical protein